MPIDSILALLPTRATEALSEYREDIICEIRIRADRPLTVTTPSANILTSVVCTRTEISDIVGKMCGGSLHAFLPRHELCRSRACVGGNIELALFGGKREKPVYFLFRNSVHITFLLSYKQCSAQRLPF